MGFSLRLEKGGRGGETHGKDLTFVSVAFDTADPRPAGRASLSHTGLETEIWLALHCPSGLWGLLAGGVLHKKKVSCLRE